MGFAGGVMLQYAPLIFENSMQLRIPAVYPLASFVEAGGLLSYSLGSQEVSRVVARHVDKILKGAKPSEIPVEEPTTYELAINRAPPRRLDSRSRLRSSRAPTG